jgi:hypothetical protein
MDRDPALAGAPYAASEQDDSQALHHADPPKKTHRAFGALRRSASPPVLLRIRGYHVRLVPPMCCALHFIQSTSAAGLFLGASMAEPRLSWAKPRLRRAHHADGRWTRGVFHRARQHREGDLYDLVLTFLR